MRSGSTGLKLNELLVCIGYVMKHFCLILGENVVNGSQFSPSLLMDDDLDEKAIESSFFDENIDDILS